MNHYRAELEKSEKEIENQGYLMKARLKFDTLSGGGVITPWGHAGQQLQYMSCPGPSEKCNTKSTDECFGDTYDKHLVGREFETSQPVPKHTQLIQWYGSKDWFEARNIIRQDCGTEQYPAPLRKQPVRKPKPAGAASLHSLTGASHDRRAVNYKPFLQRLPDAVQAIFVLPGSGTLERERARKQ